MQFNRLAINDLSGDGMQPFVQNEKMLVCNGEIYNHKEFDNTNTNDCKCLIPLIEKHGILTASMMIRGVFAICYTDGERVLASRDPLGVRPLFYTRFGPGKIAFASEVKGLLEFNTRVEIFPPGHVYDSVTDQFSCWYPCYWDVPGTVNPPSPIKQVFEESVKIRIQNTDRNVAFLLSGGLDSSLVAAIGKKYLCTKIKTFSIGTSVDSPDLKAARVMAEFLDSDHTEILFDPIKDGLPVIEQVIYSLESYDTTTVRASVPMWLLAKHISENTDYKVILSGEGSDELFGGYLYFHYAPSVNDFSKECSRRLRLIHQFDGLRADRCMAAHGLELRVPFLDKKFVELGMTIDQSLKVPGSKMEKWVLREAFEGVLPKEILWRQKNGMSDAVGYNWVDTIKQYCDWMVSDSDFHKIKENARGHNVPMTKEEAFYREKFWDFFKKSNDHLISEIWRPRWTDTTDPSARQLGILTD
jgi:asparagine synthase (glutamine-hydrolysing)